jgi:hypothetical protein
VKWSIAEGKKKGRPPTPEQQAFMDSEPGRGDPGVALLAGAYAVLSTERHFGMGAVGPIPIGAVWNWIDRHELTGTPAGERFEDLMLAVDAETMMRQRKPKA